MVERHSVVNKLGESLSEVDHTSEQLRRKRESKIKEAKIKWKRGSVVELSSDRADGGRSRE